VGSRALLAGGLRRGTGRGIGELGRAVGAGGVEARPTGARVVGKGRGEGRSSASGAAASLMGTRAGRVKGRQGRRDKGVPAPLPAGGLVRHHVSRRARTGSG
jgi:hypothetical protein